MPFVAIFNAGIREKIFTRYFRELTCHQLSTLTLMILMSAYTWLIFPFLKIDQPANAWLNGFIWLLLTLLFEFLAGHFIFKNSWEKLLQDYNLLKGRVWGLFTFFMLILPYLIYEIRN
jgi:hypothetical protein